MMTSIRPIPILSIGLSHPELKLTAKMIMKMIFFSLDKLVIDSIELPPTTVDKVISEKKKHLMQILNFFVGTIFNFCFIPVQYEPMKIRVAVISSVEMSSFVYCALSSRTTVPHTSFFLMHCRPFIYLFSVKLIQFPLKYTCYET